MRVTQMPASGGHNMRKIEQPVFAVSRPQLNHSDTDIKNLLSRLQKDDYILLGIIAVLVFEGCDDYILLAALGYLFFMGIKD